MFGVDLALFVFIFGFDELYLVQLVVNLITGDDFVVMGSGIGSDGGIGIYI